MSTQWPHLSFKVLRDVIDSRFPVAHLPCFVEQCLGGRASDAEVVAVQGMMPSIHGSDGLVAAEAEAEDVFKRFLATYQELELGEGPAEVKQEL